MPNTREDLREKVRKRAKGYCEYCYAPMTFSPIGFDLDHIIPVSKNGQTNFSNLALACGECNGHKYTKIQYTDPITSEKVDLFHPRKDYWPEHFQWNEDDTLIVGISPKGRATLDLLDMNREGNVNLRILLLMVGLHPPKEYVKG